MNRITEYKLWWISHGANHNDETEVEEQFENHINSMTMFELFSLFERIEDGVYETH